MLLQNRIITICYPNSNEKLFNKKSSPADLLHVFARTLEALSTCQRGSYKEFIRDLMRSSKSGRHMDTKGVFNTSP